MPFRNQKRIGGYAIELSYICTRYNNYYTLCKYKEGNIVFFLQISIAIRKSLNDKVYAFEKIDMRILRKLAACDQFMFSKLVSACDAICWLKLYCF